MFVARKCFYSFHFKPDCWRAGTVRSIGAIEGNEPASDNDWEAITSGADKDAKIERWIAGQMSGKTCTIVLVGTDTANRKWINHEIVRSWDAKMGVVGIRIHGLKNNQSLTSTRSEEHTSELQSLMRTSSAVFCLKKKKKTN